MAKDNKVSAPLTCQPGDLVAIVCPARKASAADLAPAVELLEQWGYRVRLGQSVGAEFHQFGGEDALRSRDLLQQLADPEVKAIFCARGGYGCARLLPELDRSFALSHPKWLVGFSDATALHAWWWKKTGLASLHGPMPMLFARTAPAALDKLRDALQGDSSPFQSPPHPLNQTGRAKGRLLGGNLSVLYSLRGTPWFPPLEGAVLFLEDLDEYLYHVDRMALNLELGGILDRIAGLVVGGMTDMRDHAVPFGADAETILRDRLGSRTIPLAFGLPAGHLADNRPLILGREVELLVDSQGSTLRYRPDGNPESLT